MNPPTSFLPAPRRPGRTRSFTLIELLVTISIIAVLAALLFPSLTSALNKARQTKCAGILRQWGLGFQYYQGDNDGVLPTYALGDNWQEGIASYLVTGTPGILRVALRKNLDCPADARRYNTWAYGTSLQLIPRNNPGAPQKMTSLRGTDRLLLLVDCGDEGFWDTPASTNGSTAVFYSRHRGVANFLFADQHVEALTPAQAQAKVVVNPNLLP